MANRECKVMAYKIRPWEKQSVPGLTETKYKARMSRGPDRELSSSDGTARRAAARHYRGPRSRS